MRAATLLFAVACGWASAAAQSQPAAAPTQPAAHTAPSRSLSDDELAAESLVNSATALIHAPADTPARPARLVGLVRLAERLDAGNPRVQRLLATIHEIQGNNSEAAASLARCLAATPHDHATGVRWLTLRLATLDDADSRVASLQAVIDDEAVAAPLRAEAAARQARIYDGQGDTQAVKNAFAKALELDPYHPDALRGTLELSEQPTPAQRVAVGVKLLKGNPLAVATAWELATLLNGLGLHDEAVGMFDYAWGAFLQRNAPQQASGLFIVQYFDAMLDAGQPEEALAIFEPMAAQFGGSGDFQAVMLEAMRECGDEEGEGRLLARMTAMYDARRLASPDAGELAEQAWFHVAIKPDPPTALRLAQSAADAADDSPLMQRILGAAELAAGQEQQGIERLEKLTGTDMYAAAIIAEHYFAADNEEAARQAIEAAAALPRGGPAWRKLRALAEEYEVDLPAVSGSEEARQAIAAWDEPWRQLGLHPEKTLAVKLTALIDPLPPGRPAVLAAAISNTGSLPVPLGEWGLLQPILALRVEMDQTAEPFTDLPLVLWPAPRYLAPGQTVMCPVRLDTADLGAALTKRPLDELTLTVHAAADPLARGNQIAPAMPAVTVEPLGIRRSGLLGEFDRQQDASWPAAYELALGRIVRDIRRGGVADRQAAARNIASLFAMVDRTFHDPNAIPPQLANAVGRPVLLTMLRAALEDPSPAVRAEMVASLAYVELDESILSLLAAVIGDDSPLVRFRVAELLGASQAPGWEMILPHFAADSDELVRQLAAAFIAPPPAAATQPEGERD